MSNYSIVCKKKGGKSLVLSLEILINHISDGGLPSPGKKKKMSGVQMVLLTLNCFPFIRQLHPLFPPHASQEEQQEKKKKTQPFQKGTDSIYS